MPNSKSVFINEIIFNVLAGKEFVLPSVGYATD
jgi:hypothetical protein